MNAELLDKIKKINLELAEDGYQIKGIFGSFAKNSNNESSDIDLLFDLDESFNRKYKGFSACERLEEIENYMSKKLDIPVDTVRISSLGTIGKKYILKEVIYV